MDKNSKILIVGHDDVIEKSLVSYFRANGFANVVSSSAVALDTAIQPSVHAFFQKHRPEYVFLGSTRSGGIEANQKNGGEFLYHNSESQNNVIHAAYKFGVKKLLYCAASCVYPKDVAQPIKEEYLLTGKLEPTSQPYSIAKISGIQLCQAYRQQYGLNAVAVVPATVYGPGSDTNLEKAHVMGALIAKFQKAVAAGEREVTVWGSGKPRREFLFAEDFAEACLFLMDQYNDLRLLNVGCGTDVSIAELAEIIKKVSGYSGKIVFDATKPDGAMAKLLDNSRIRQLGWKPKVKLEEGIRRTYEWYKLSVISSQPSAKSFADG